VVSALPAGRYRMDVTQKGFDTITREIELQVSQIVLADFQLTVGTVSGTRIT
jgi:hypothetical protein